VRALWLELISIFQFILDYIGFAADVLDDEVFLERARAVFSGVRKFETIRQIDERRFI